ncbi:MAG: hypothetical protein ACRECY_16000, partial [Phyllobacterium sp.]
MAKYFIIGETGKDQLWVIDIAAKSVEPLTDAIASADDASKCFFQSVKTIRQNGTTVIKGINIAIASDSRSGADTKMH